MRINRRSGALITAAVAIGIGLIVIPTHQAVGAPSATTTELVVNKGGDRLTAQSAGPLAGAVFDFFAGTAGTVPAANATPTASCTTTATGACHVDVPGRTGGSGNNQQGYWIRERTAPSGFAIAQVLDTGTNANNAAPNPYNRLFTGPVANNTTNVFPQAGTGSSQNSRGSAWADIRNNPPLPPDCGLNIAMLIDTSGSIGGDIGNVKNAANGFVTALTGTPSQIALYSFATDASQRLTSTAVSTVAGANTVKSAINALPNPSGSTNWDQGLFQIAAQPTPYDAVIMLTDGNPTVYGPPPATGPGDHTRFREVENGIFSANSLKAEGTRVVVVGVGSGVTGATDNLAAISGPTAGSDYFQTDYAQLDELFRQLALATCEGTISVVKQVIPPFGTIDDAQPAGGWTLTSATSGVTPMSGQTDDTTGGVSFSAPLNGAPSLPVTLSETVQSGFTLFQVGGKNATCADSSGSPVAVMNSGGAGFTTNALANDAVTCIVYNQAAVPPAEVKVTKTWDINGTSYVDGKQPVDFQTKLSLTDQVDPEFGTVYSGYQQGDSVTVGEAVDTDMFPPGCTNVPGGDLGDHTLAAGLNTFALTNTVTCTTTLTLFKHVVNSFGTPADPNLWTLTAAASNGSQTFDGTTGVKENVTADLSYLLSESDVPGYKQVTVSGAQLPPDATGSWHCVLRRKDGSTGSEFDGLNGSVTVALGENAECTAINVAQPAKLTLKKVVINSHGGTAGPTDWTLTATPNSANPAAKVITGRSGQAAVTNKTAIPGAPYALAEADGPGNYSMVGDPECVLTGTTTPATMDGSTLTPNIGQDITCTFTNQDVLVPPTSLPPTSPPPLPPTGSNFGPIAGSGAAAFLVGLGLLIVTLRRRRWMDEI